VKLLFVASECVPFAKSGGLGDVIGALPKPLAKLGADVRVILPKYEDIPERFKLLMEQHTITYWNVQLGWREQYCGIQQLVADGITYYFVDNEFYFKRKGLYGYGDEAERYVFFCRAVIEALPRIGFQPDLIHCHDWQTGLIPYLLKNKYREIPFYARAKSIFTIHNLMYQGVFSEDLLRDLIGIDPWDSSLKELEHHGGVSCLKGGLIYADRITTVSETYAEEIQTPEYGEYLDGLLRYRSGDLIGIVNGIDYELYDPMKDTHLAVPYRDSLVKKQANKLALQQEAGLQVDESIPVIAMVTRLVEQKGLDLLEAVLHELMRERVQMIVLGTGDDHYEQFLHHASSQYPGRLSANIRFDDGLARRIYAGADLFLMPSRFEPCGIGQLLALRYRTIPIVRETGGLKDTVMPYNEFTGEGWGFSFAEYSAHDMFFTIVRALKFYQDSQHWARIHANVKKLDYSWKQSAEAYYELYRELS
jgi:ADP-glucose type glycogen/starch synthase